MPRKLYYATDPTNLNYGDGRSRRTTRPTSWAHNRGSGLKTLTDADGNGIYGGDGVHRESLVQTVVSGTPLGRPENEYESVMMAPPGQEAELDGEAVQASSNRVDAILSLLPPNQAAVVSLIAVGGLSVREAADHLTVGKSQVDRLYKKGLATLAGLLGQPLEGMPGMTKFPEETVTALDEMVPDGQRCAAHKAEPTPRPDCTSCDLGVPELGEYLDPEPPDSDNADVSDEEWVEYQEALAAARKGRASKGQLQTVKATEKRLGLPSSFSPAWNSTGSSPRKAA